MEKQHSFTVSALEDGLRIDRILSERFPGIRRADWQLRIKNNTVWTTQNKSPRPSTKVHTGEEITFRFEKRPEPPVNRDVRIVHRDEAMLVIDKPANLPVHPTGLYHKNTLSEILKETLGTQENPYTPRPVHRLDRETSGLIVFGETTDSARKLNRQFLSGTVQKEYLVITEGHFPDYADANGYLGRLPGFEVQKFQRFTEAKPDYPARTARTEFFRLMSGRLKDEKEISLIRAILHTGRTHQIRATLHSLGYPVTGDCLYGVDPLLYLKFIHGQLTEEDRAALRISRTALHSFRLQLHHPLSNEQMVFTSEMPKDMQTLLKQAVAGSGNSLTF